MSLLHLCDELLFGAPVAHEDHAQRACYAALSSQKALGVYEEKVKREFGVEFKMRMGVNSGPVIVGSIGDDLRMDYTALGDTTNLAARIQQFAKPGQVWVSQETHHIIRNYFHDELVIEYEKVFSGGSIQQPIAHFRHRFSVPDEYTDEKIIDTLIWRAMELQRKGLLCNQAVQAANNRSDPAG
jgi:class 3 adenylate cyclase